MKTASEDVVSWSVINPWHIGPPAPNGCVPGQRERYVTTYRVYAADYYGRGSKLYMAIKDQLQTQYGFSTIALSNEGNETYIQAAMDRSGVTH